jgi:hypothetical protein
MHDTVVQMFLVARLVAFLIASTCFLPVAKAVLIHEPKTDLRLELAARDAVVCVIIPTELRDRGCDGLEDEMLDGVDEATASPLRAAVALLRFADWQAVFTLTTTDARLVSAEQLDGYLDGMAKGLTESTGCPARFGASMKSHRYELFDIDDYPMARYQFDLACPADSPVFETSALVGYLLPAQNGTNMVSFATHPAHARRLTELAAGIVGTARTPRFDARRFGEPPANRLAYALGRFVGAMFLPAIAGVIVAIALLARARRQRAKSEPRTGPQP